MGLKLGLNSFVFELKETRNVPQGAHHEIVIMPSLGSADPRQLELKPCHGKLFDDFSDGALSTPMRALTTPRLQESL